MNNVLGKTYNLLDKGFIRVIDVMGDDSSIVQAARVSYGKGTKSVNEDRGLIRYLLRHRHTSPFEMCELKIHVKMPIFVARQWIRHRTANLNEISARYSVMENEFYIPELDDLCQQSKSNKQGRDNPIEKENAEKIQDIMKKINSDSFNEYENLIKDNNLARELARTILPVSLYTEMYWKIDLHNLLHFIALRIHPHAQKEIRVYAEALMDIVKNWLPLVHEAFVDYRINSIEMSGFDVKKLSNLLDNEKVKNFISENQNLKGEGQEFLDKLKKIIDSDSF